MVNIDMIILGVLQGMPMHGYQLKQYIEASFGKHFFNMSNSALYPRLARLEAEGFIESHREEQEKIPDRKVYRVTEAGLKRFHDLVLEPLGPREDFQDFMAHAVFFGLLTPEERRRFIEPLLKESEAELKEAQAKHDRFGKYMDKHSLFVLNYGTEEIQNQIKFLRTFMEMT